MSSPYIPRYDLRLKALCYRRLLPAPPRFPPRARSGGRCDVSLRVTVLPGSAQLHLEYHYTSGHAWMIDDDRPPVEEPLGAALSAAQLDEIASIQSDASLWSPEVLLGLFRPMRSVGTQPVRAAEADFFELGESVTFDGRIPMLTLRLGRAHDEIVLDRSFVWPSQERRIEVRARLEPGTPGALSAIEGEFGADMAAAAACFHETRSQRFR